MSRTAKILSSVFVAIVLIAAFFPQLIAPGNPLAVNPSEAFLPPSAQHLFGTDESGRDTFIRVVHGTSDALLIGISATGLGMGIAILLGTLAALTPRWVDESIMRLVDVLYAVPALLFALVIIAFTGPGVPPAIIAVGLSTAPGYTRLIRTQIMALRNSDMMEAATVLGHTTGRKIINHLIPNVLSTLLALMTLGIGQAVIWASALSFLGLGTPPPAPEWGAMLANGRTYLHFAWWLTLFPGLAIAAVAAGATLIGRSMSTLPTTRGGRP